MNPCDSVPSSKSSGKDSGKKEKFCYAYDPTLPEKDRDWKEFCDLKKERSNHASAILKDGSIWITGRDKFRLMQPYTFLKFQTLKEYHLVCLSFVW